MISIHTDREGESKRIEQVASTAVAYGMEEREKNRSCIH